MRLNEKKSKIVNNLLSLVVQEKIRPGQNLPAERKLAERFDVSRNSIREVIKILEERGVVEVYPGSGCYLKKKIETDSSLDSLDPNLSPDIIIDHLEARLVTMPMIGSLIVERITEKDIKNLEDMMVGLSRAIIDRNFREIVAEENKFRHILAGATGNEIVINIVEQLELNNELSWEKFNELPESGLNEIFACYVKTLNAIRERDSRMIQQYIRNTILTMCILLNRHTRFKFSEEILEQIEIYNSKPGGKNEDKA